MSRAISGPHPVTISDEDDARFQEMERQADLDVATAAARGEERLTLRLSRDQASILRRAAAFYGLPYPDYFTQAALRQAIADLATAAAAGVTSHADANR